MRAQYSLYLLIALVLALTVWAYLTPIDISVRARGMVRPSGGFVKVLTEVSGRITQFSAHEGDTVRRGDILLTLDDKALLLRHSALLSAIHLSEPHASMAAYHDLEQIQLELTRLTITAPVSGRITSLAPLHVGEVITSGSAIATILPDSEPLIIESWLSSSDRPHVSLGQLVRLRRDTSYFSGEISSISPDVRMDNGLPFYRVAITYSPPEAGGVARQPAGWRAGVVNLGDTFDVHFITRHDRILFLLFHRIRREFEEAF